MQNRVVVTGMGVCSPNGIGLPAFLDALRNGTSGLRHQKELESLKFRCQVAGKPIIEDTYLNNYFTNVQLRGLESTGLVYGVISGKDAWSDAGLTLEIEETPDWDSGIIFGTGILGVDRFRKAIYDVDKGNVRRLGSTTVIQTMASGISAFLGGMLGCGNQVTTNSSACTTGTEALLMGYEKIKVGQAKRMLVGSCSDSGPYVWGGFDAMRILPGNHNDKPEKASRPMSASAQGFVPGSGAGALVLESLESALDRSAKIYCEILGGHINSGGHRSGGSMTAPNRYGVRRCIQKALESAQIQPHEVDAINGHLTATSKDVDEIANWSEALGVKNMNFPYVNSFKGMIGHCLAAAGSIECVGTVLQISEKNIFGNVNCEDVHPDIAQIINASRIPQTTLAFGPKIVAKASFGFGDVNACAIFKAYSED